MKIPFQSPTLFLGSRCNHRVTLVFVVWGFKKKNTPNQRVIICRCWQMAMMHEWSSLWVPNHKYIYHFFIVSHSWNWKRLQNNQYVNTNTEHSLLSNTSAATAATHRGLFLSGCVLLQSCFLSFIYRHRSAGPEQLLQNKGRCSHFLNFFNLLTSVEAVSGWHQDRVMFYSLLDFLMGFLFSSTMSKGFENWSFLFIPQNLYGRSAPFPSLPSTGILLLNQRGHQ